MATPPPQRSVFSLFLRQLDAFSAGVGAGGVQGEKGGLGMVPGSSRFLEGGWRGAPWLELVDWDSSESGGAQWPEPWTLGPLGQGEAPIQSLVQPHSCGLQGPQPPPFRPFILCSAGPRPHSRVVRAGRVSCLLSANRTERRREGQDKRRRQERPWHRTATCCSAAEGLHLGESVACVGAGPYLPTPSPQV